MRYTISIILLALAILFMIAGCAGTSSESKIVGPYKHPEQNPQHQEYYKAHGHRGFELSNPSESVIDTYCSVCHWIF